VDWKGRAKKKKKKENQRFQGRVRTGELTYGGLSKSEGGEKRKDREGLHDGNGEGRKGGAAVKERLSLFVYKLTNNVVVRRCKGAVNEAEGKDWEWDGKRRV
jgi:hypothetical protein